MRLACVKPAASVRSEPGSNSPVKYDRSRGMRFLTDRPALRRLFPLFSFQRSIFSGTLIITTPWRPVKGKPEPCSRKPAKLEDHGVAFWHSPAGSTSGPSHLARRPQAAGSVRRQPQGPISAAGQMVTESLQRSSPWGQFFCKEIFTPSCCGQRVHIPYIWPGFTASGISPLPRDPRSPARLPTIEARPSLPLAYPQVPCPWPFRPTRPCPGRASPAPPFCLPGPLPAGHFID